MALSKMSLLAPPGDPTESEVSGKLRSDWNMYTQWLEKKGYKGHPALDKNDLGGKMIDIYRKENPTTSVTRENIKPIQTEFSKYRDWVLDRVKNKKAELSPGTTPENFLRNLSVIDGIAGQRTTSFAFPSAYLQTFVDKKLQNVENKGFATIK